MVLSIYVIGQDLEGGKYAKILGLQVSSDLTRNNHIFEIVKKVSKASVRILCVTLCRKNFCSST